MDNSNYISFFGWLQETHSDEYNEFLEIYKKQYNVDKLSTTEVLLFLVWISTTYPEKYNDLLKQYKK